MQQTDGTQELYFLYDDSNQPYALVYKSSATAEPLFYYYLLNVQGDVIGLLNASGEIVAEYQYDPWGVPMVMNSSGTVMEQSTFIGNVNPLRYRGYYYDTETGFYYLQSRYYDPAIGRFISADNYASTGQGFIGCNMFAYCGNNPVNYSDPSGRLAAIPVVIGLFVATLVVGTAAILGATQSLADGIKDFAKSTHINPHETHDQSVYVLQDKSGNVHYVGRTNDPDRRKAEHKNDPKHPERASYDMKVIATGLSKPQARVAEQIFISAYSIQSLDNLRREIAIKKLGNFKGEISVIIELYEGVAEDELWNLMEGN